MPRQGVAIGMGTVARRRCSAPATDEGEAAVAQTDQVLSRQGHAETEIRPDMVALAAAEAAQDLHHRQSEAAQAVDSGGVGAFGGAQEKTADAMLAHALDEAILTRWRFGGIGEKGEPARAIERLVDACGELGVERVGDLTDDEPDGLGLAR